ncbi:MAG: carboxylate-amine ligase [Rhodobiaceae bacterium]|nr:carboxylate-amine ligase [Rhodobiaceae bacterium]
MEEPSFTIGVEEEYLLIDRQTRNLAADPPHEFMEACEKRLGKAVSPEFLRCQVEIGTPVCQSTAEAGQALARLRGTIAEVARDYDLAPLAVSTHPFADWDALLHTDRKRYNDLAADLQVVARRLMICGMHVHVAIEDEAARIDILNQLAYFIPHLLALSTSSPFWRGKKTGLKSYRLAVFDEMPRTGLPEAFDSPGHYHRTVDTLVQAGVIEDATKIWWDLRPSGRFPTLEMRVMDVCTRLEDALAVASLMRCVTRMLYRLRRNNQRWRKYSNFLIRENRWLAQRHGASGSLIDFGKGERVPYKDLIDEILELIEPDAEFFGCRATVEHARAIAAEGTSADRQLARYAAETDAGVDHDEALRRVVDQIAEETLQGT